VKRCILQSDLREPRRAPRRVIYSALGIFLFGYVDPAPRAVFLGHRGEKPGLQRICEFCAADSLNFIAMMNGENCGKGFETLAPDISTRLHRWIMKVMFGQLTMAST
jgi:hypothetical protein